MNRLNNKIEDKLSYLNNIDVKFDFNDIFDYIDNNVVLNEHIFWDAFKNTYVDNFSFIKQNISILQAWWKLEKDGITILEQIENINSKSIEVSINLYNDLFKDFLPKTHTSWDWKNSIKKYNLAFLNDSFYTNSCSKQWFDILNWLYLLSVNYLISYNKWLINISNNFNKSLKDKDKIDKDIQVKIQEIWNNINVWNNLEDNILRKLLFLIWFNLDKELALDILSHIEKWRFKTIESSIKKLLKSSKYREQFKKENILQDQLGFLLKYKNFDDIKDTSKKVKKLLEETEYIDWKFNDRWILEKKHDNKDTLAEHLFVNTWFIIDNSSLWELSLRWDNSKFIDNIITKNSLDPKLLFKDLILKVDDLNHGIYKLSQDIKIIRNVFVDNDKINRSRNFNKSVKEYLAKKIKIIEEEIKKWIKEILENRWIKVLFTNEHNIIIRLITTELLEDKVYNVIKDIAWEYVKDDIKWIKEYKKLKDHQKKDFLKKISTKFSEKLENNNVQIDYMSKDLMNIFKAYKRRYKAILETAYFYKEIKNIERVSKRALTKIEKTSSDLFENLS